MGDEGLGKVTSVGARDCCRYVTPPGGKGVGDSAFSRYGVATMVMEIQLMVGGFNMDGSAELTSVDINIDIQEGDMGLGGVPGFKF